MEYFSKSGVLPLKVSPTGDESEELGEIIICDSISGGKQYENQMPVELTLVRKLSDGTEFRASYIQQEVLHSIFDNDESQIVRNEKDGYPEGRPDRELTLKERLLALCRYAADWKTLFEK